MLAWKCQADGIPRPKLDHLVHHVKQWRIDLAWPTLRVGVDIDGGIWLNGTPHPEASGFIDDMERHNALQLLDWCMVRVTPSQIETGAAMEVIRRAHELAAVRTRDEERRRSRP